MLKPFLRKDRIEAGCDEAGRGPLAGPVFAAAVILPADYRNSLLDDSKKLNLKKRTLLREQIEKDAVTFSVASASVGEIDKINILNASILAMHRAIAGLKTIPGFLLIDGNRFQDYPGIPSQTVIKGDGIYMSIAAASILAKTYRDDHMISLHAQFPQYGWDSNKGYPTALHRSALLEFGSSPHHRKSFALLHKQLKLKI